MRNRGLDIDEPAAVTEGVRRDVEDAQDRRAAEDG